MTEKQTKLASYWNTPFDKICLGMKVNNVTKWIMIDHQASSLFNVIADEDFKNTSVGRGEWLSLMDGSCLQENCNKEGFNLESAGVAGYNDGGYIRVRIGIIANNVANCNGCDTCIGFGTSAYGCNNENIRAKKTTCGNIAMCNYFNNKNNPAFGYIFVQ